MADEQTPNADRTSGVAAIADLMNSAGQAAPVPTPAPPPAPTPEPDDAGPADFGHDQPADDGGSFDDDPIGSLDDTMRTVAQQAVEYDYFDRYELENSLRDDPEGTLRQLRQFNRSLRLMQAKSLAGERDNGQARPTEEAAPPAAPQFELSPEQIEDLFDGDEGKARKFADILNKLQEPLKQSATREQQRAKQEAEQRFVQTAQRVFESSPEGEHLYGKGSLESLGREHRDRRQNMATIALALREGLTKLYPNASLNDEELLRLAHKAVAYDHVSETQRAALKAGVQNRHNARTINANGTRRPTQGASPVTKTAGGHAAREDSIAKLTELVNAYSGS